MARGWESKAIESQQADAAARSKRAGTPGPGEQAREARREALRLARARVTGDLTVAVQPAHRTMLERALAALDAELAGLG